VTGEREERLVQAGLAERELRELDAPVIALAGGARQQRLLGEWRRDRAGLGVGADLGAGQLLEQRGGLGQAGGIGRGHQEHLAARPGLQLVRRPGRDHLAPVDDHDVVG